ncbi:MAG: hypothetical protein HPY62_07440 [Bacteroidales bacterium]|nr:hypothetical protein [Bacteroidales bacterium]
MKKQSLIITGLLLLLATIANAQTKTGIQYFEGKWNTVVSSPYGDVKMVICFEKNNDKISSSIKDSEGKDLYKVEKTSVQEKQATITFIGSQGVVDMILTKKDEDNLTGDIMGGIASVQGTRLRVTN